MIQRIKSIINDIKRGQNIESYIVIMIAVVVAIIDIFNLSEPSWVAEATLAVLSLLAYSNIQSSRTTEELQESLKAIRGGHHFEKNQKIDVLSVHQRMESAKTIDWVAFTNQKTINMYRTSLVKCLSKGGKIRILLINPYSDMAKTVAQNGYSWMHDAERQYKEGVQYTIRFCDQLKKEAANGSIEVRFLSVHPPYRITIYNRDYHEGGFVRIHLLKAPNTSEAATIGWYKKDDIEWFQYFVGQYESLWNTSEADKGLSEINNLDNFSDNMLSGKKTKTD